MAIVTTEASALEFTNVKDIDGNVDACTIKVQIILKWKSFYTNNPSIESSLDFIFEDEKGDRIFGTVKKGLIKDFEHKLKEGEAYIISNFGVGSNGGDYRVVDHKAKINFYKFTSVRAAKNFEQFGLYFRFVDFQDVAQRRPDTTITFDVIGRLISSDDMRVFQASGKCVVNIRLQDLSGVIINCSLWGEHAKKMHTFVKEKGCSDGPVVVLLQLAKFLIYNDAPQVSNSVYGSRLFINGEMPEIKQFMESMNNIGADANSVDVVVQLSSNTVVSNEADYYNNFEFKHFDELLEISEPIGCVVVGKVLRIDHQPGWYYHKCKVCHSVATSNDEGATHPFYCKQCGDIKDVYKKIRVSIIVQDPTGTVSLTMFEREVTRIIKKPASVLFAKIGKMPANALYPDDLNLIVDKTFVFKLSITEFNISARWHSFTLNTLSDNADLMKYQLKRSSHFEDAISEAETPLNVIDGSLDLTESKDVNSITEDSSTQLQIVGSSSTSPYTKRSFESLEDDVNLQSSSSKDLTLANKLKKPKVEKL